MKFLKQLTPTRMVRSISEINPATLRAMGISAIITDLDNTIVPWGKTDVSDELVKWLADLESAGIKICIASNTIHTGRLKKLSETLGIPFVDRVRKPNVEGFVRAMKMMNAELEQTAVLGDQLFTDILCGNRLGVHTILLYPPLAKRDFVTTAAMRYVEKCVIFAQRRRGEWPEHSISEGS